jgi:hypothetical protein
MRTRTRLLLLTTLLLSGCGTTIQADVCALPVPPASVMAPVTINFLEGMDQLLGNSTPTQDMPSK